MTSGPGAGDPTPDEAAASDDRGAAFKRALDRLPVRDGAPPPGGNGQAAGNGHAGGNGHTGGNGHAGDAVRTPGGAPPKLTSPDEITAPRLEASLAKLLNSTGAAKARSANREEPVKRSRTMPAPEKRPATDRLAGRSKTKRTRIVAPTRPSGASPAKLPPLKPTRLVQAPPKAPPKAPATPPAAAAPAPPPPVTEPPPAPERTPAAPAPPAAAPAAAPGPKISSELADILGNAETSSITRPKPSPMDQAAPTAPGGLPGETTNEFENLLEGLLGDRGAAAAIPGEPADPPPASPRKAGPNDQTSAFSADTPIFQGPEGGEGNLSDFVSKILGEFDSIVEEPGDGQAAGGVNAPAAPPSAPAGPPRAQRETVAFEEAFEAMQRKPSDDRETRAEPAPAQRPQKRPPGKDTRASKETGEFEEGEGTGPGITPDELSQLSDLFNED